MITLYMPQSDLQGWVGVGDACEWNPPCSSVGKMGKGGSPVHKMPSCVSGKAKS